MQQSNGFDITGVAQEASLEDVGTKVHLLDLNNKPMYFMKGEQLTPVTITVAGSNSKLYRSAEAAIRKRKISAKSLTGQTFHDDQIEKAAACTLDWDGILNNGSPVRCDRVNVVNLYSLLPFVLEQVVEAMNDHERFSGGSSPTLSSTSAPTPA